MKPLNLTFDAKNGNLRQLLVLFVITICIVLSRKTTPAAEPGASNAATNQTQLVFINTSFEHACPLYWEVDSKGIANVYLLYDQERSSQNRANGHWFFQLQAKKGSDLTIILNNFDNVWNGKKGSPISDRTICFISNDGRKWRAVGTKKIDGNRLELQIHMDQDTLFVARLEPYRLSDLEKLKIEIRNHRLVAILPIGHTVEGRELEIIRIGNPDAPYRVLLRARSHPWESGGSWVVQGLIKRLLRDDKDSRRYLARYCVYIIPMANKDGVMRGRTRFNMLGKDLNRNWDQRADRHYAPENYALESWMESMIAKGQSPHLAIDLHNDESGKLHVSWPNIDLESYLNYMEYLEQLLRNYTWFTEGSTGKGYRNPGTFGEGLLERYSIVACVLELNANWIAGLKQYPSGKNWELFGRQLCEVFFHYFDSKLCELEGKS
ncbi:MAG: M14 family zinc carboxypeptidase [Planctomycetota bacterium]|jgi:hypothetical protein